MEERIDEIERLLWGFTHKVRPALQSRGYDPEDFVQDCFLRFSEKKSALTYENRGKLGGYVYFIAKQEYSDFLGKANRGRLPTYDVILPQEDVEPLLDALLRRLPDEPIAKTQTVTWRELFRLFCEHSPKEIAKILGVSWGRALQFKALLKERLGLDSAPG